MRIKNIKNFINKKRVGSLALTYFALTGLGFVFIYPIFYMLINSFFSITDLTDPGVIWIPRELYLNNFKEAFRTLDFTKSFLNSMMMSIVPAILQTAVTACIGFGLARFNFFGKKIFFILILATFLLPSQIMMVPRYVIFDKYNMINTVFPQYLPALFGQGLKSAIFILVFYQYFNSYPKTFDEAAELDGAGKFRILCLIALPLAVGAVVLSLLFSFVWYWNETYLSSFLFGSQIQTLPLKLHSFTAQYEAIYGGESGLSANINESISLAGTLLSIIPVLILYICLQRQFIESIEQSGITGE